MSEAPNGWVIQEWRALARRPLILGLPFGAAGTLLILSAFLGVIAGFLIAALILFISLWTIGAAITRYDPWAWELFLGMIRVPGTLRAS
ncbi:VirB3 family type IV secretion system protein [Marinivivus vitaminiproducens]|uniref:VirB3 family type IV secretion system protein n=1 Tax=Marinivivus vitaminiproducens TaxID=3035935 RepID=UPI00279EE231|nr:VirB3 family type IV secretion system protein [Geminicoccaceae bacterium SCSIO 64248]